MQNYYKITCSYQGTNYWGWQIQDNGPTVQGHINNVLAKISKCNPEDIKTLASGRTDRGVHALAQVFRATLALEIEALSLKKAMNSLLNNDIRIVHVEPCESDFHPIRDSISKKYVYLFSWESSELPFDQPFIAPCPKVLDLEKIKKALKLIEGTHDFSNFRTLGTDVKTTIKTIYKAEIQEAEQTLGPFRSKRPVYQLSFEGDGFLKQMVRLLVGAIWNIGSGKIELVDLEKALKAESEVRIGAVAPACGLYLHSVKYP